MELRGGSPGSPRPDGAGRARAPESRSGGVGEASPGTSSPQPALGAARAVPSRAGAGAGARSMAGLPGTVRPRSGSPGASAALPAPRLAALDGAFVCSPLGGLMGAQAVSTEVPGGGKGGSVVDPSGAARSLRPRRRARTFRRRGNGFVVWLAGLSEGAAVCQIFLNAGVGNLSDLRPWNGFLSLQADRQGLGS